MDLMQVMAVDPGGAHRDQHFIGLGLGDWPACRRQTEMALFLNDLDGMHICIDLVGHTASTMLVTVPDKSDVSA